MSQYEKYSEQIKDLYDRKIRWSVNQELMNTTFKYSDKNKIENEIKNKHLQVLESKNKYILKCPNCLNGKIHKREEDYNSFGVCLGWEIIECKYCKGVGNIAILEEDLPLYTTFIKGIK